MKKYIYTLLVILFTQVAIAQVTYPTIGQSSYIISSGESSSVTDDQSITFGPGTLIEYGATFSASIIDETTADVAYSDTYLSTDENYIFTRSYQKEMSSFDSSEAKEGDVIESIVYFDGRGRPMQQIAIKASPQIKDIITHVGYDNYGRQDKDWLPYHETTGSLGAYRGDKDADTRSYYKTNYAEDFTDLSTTTANAYSEKQFEASPLNRILKQAAPGQDWRMDNGNEIAFEYSTNTEDEVLLAEVSLSFADNTYTPTLVENGYYDAGELYKQITKDENHSSGNENTTEEFTDKQGRVVLKRTYDAYDPHDTYYIYDDFGNLTYVLPPKVTADDVSETELDGLSYQYKYDDRNRLVEKKIPGKEWEYIVYNKLDQPILTQDANLKADGEWLFTKYDAFGRVVYTGKIADSSSRIQLQTAANSTTYASQYELKTTETAVGGKSIFYSNNAMPQNISETLTVNYYDSYEDTNGLSVPATVYEQDQATNVKGLTTVSKVKVLETDHWITTITGYDKKGRAIYTASRNDYLETTDVVELELDFAGKVLISKTSHARDGATAIVTEEAFVYDHQGRLLRQKQEIDNQSQETLVDNTYDNLGQLSEKSVGGSLQTINYNYNVRGWLKQINDPSNLGTDLFAFDINYNTVDNGGTPLYNGNIAETQWITANDNTLRSYKYEYDPLNRITSATGGANTNYDVSNISYDKMGNILTLNRKGHTNIDATTFGDMDDLDYLYDSGNKLLKVTDVISGTAGEGGFKDGTNTNDDFKYDDNGNMISDANKGITRIDYNHLNLPTQVVINGSGNIGIIEYVYDATGTKHKKTSTDTGAGSVSVTDYAGNYIYENDKLQFFSTPEGYVEPKDPNNLSLGYDYIYQYTDHLGNIRLSYKNVGTSTVDLEIQEENNYYPFGLKHKGYNGMQSAARNHKYGFGNKEEQDELGLGWMDFHARNYYASIGRWMNIDPLADNYRSFTPYNYVANNPVLLTDHDGRDISFSFQYEQDADGNDVLNKDGGRNLTGVTLTLTGKVIDVSGKGVDVGDAISEITNSIQSSFKGNSNGVVFNSVVNLTEAKSFDDVKESDHVFALANINEAGVERIGGKDKFGKNNLDVAGASNQTGGKVAFIDADYFSGIYDTTIGSTGERTAAHEFGHLLNFGGHNSASGFFNLMTGGGSGSNITESQLTTIINNTKFDTKINRGVNYEMRVISSPSSKGGIMRVKYPNRGEAEGIIKY